jgi:hypothetical protein
MSQTKELIVSTNIGSLKLKNSAHPDHALITQDDQELVLIDENEEIELMRTEIAYVTGIPEHEEQEVYEANDKYLAANMDPTEIAENVAGKYGLEVQWDIQVRPFKKREDDKVTGEIKPTASALVSYNITDISPLVKALPEGFSHFQPTIPAPTMELVPRTSTLEHTNGPQKVVRIAAFNFKRELKLKAS